MNPELRDQYEVQSALQKEAAQAQSALYAPELQQQVQQAQAVLIEALNPKGVVKTILLELEGKEVQTDGTIKVVNPPKINENGISDLRYLLNSFINQHITMTFLEKEQISKIMEEFQRDLVYLIGLNWKRWGMKKIDRDVINDAILINIYATLNRALEKNEKNFIGRVVMEMVAPGGMNKPKKEGIFSKLKF